MRLISSAGAEEGRDRTGDKPLRCKAAPWPEAPALQPGLKGPGHVLQPRGHCRGADRGLGEQPQGGRRDLGVSGPPKCCTSMQGAPVCSDTWPWRQHCQTWGARAMPPVLGGSIPQMWDTSQCPFLCVSTTHAYVCVHVLWVAGEGPCCSELLATSRTIRSCQGRPRHSSCSCSSRCCLSAGPAPVPALLPAAPRAPEQMQEPSARSLGTV